MILYNVTVNIDSECETEWVDWMKKVHIPDVMNTNYFYEHRFMKMMSAASDETGATYAIQYFAKKLDDLETYLDKEAPKLQKDVVIKYGSKIASFRTVLEEV